MNLDDYDFEEEWQYFKNHVGDKPFTLMFMGNASRRPQVSFGPKDGGFTGSEVIVNYDAFIIWKELGLVQNCRELRYKINPKELCSISNPSIQSDEE